jgi:cell division septation protein DedD
MVETTSWKGHSFTLMVFAGIAILCAIFFALGMLLGQSQRVSDSASTGAPAKPAPIGSEIPASPRQEPPVPAPAADPVSPAGEESSPRANITSFQIGALRQQSAAEKLFKEVQGKGFPAVILEPAAGDSNPMYRVQVGPYTDAAEAEIAKLKLESAGYKPIVKR